MRTTTKLMERLERIARKSYESDVEAGYTICFKVCITCGSAEWECSKDKGKGFKVEANERTRYEAPCERCHLVFLRAPEVFNWVLGVFNHYDEMRDSDVSQEP